MVENNSLSRLQEEGKKEGTEIHLWLIHADVWQKSNQYCKAIINQLKLNIIFLKKDDGLRVVYNLFAVMNSTQLPKNLIS